VADFRAILNKTRSVRAIEIATAVFVAVVIYFFKPEPITLSSLNLVITVGLVLFVNLEAFLLRHELQETNRAQRELMTLAASPTPKDREFFGLALRYFGGKIPASEITQVWRDLCWIFQDRYDATNYVKPDELYNEPWASPAIAIQIAKAYAAHPTQIRKIFVVDQKSELEPIRDNLNRQTEARIVVRYIECEKIAKNVAIRDRSKALKSNDFGIFDNRCVLVWNLDDQRGIVDGELIFDKEEIKKYQSFFEQLLLTSKSITHG
jgi:hypothetical protein